MRGFYETATVLGIQVTSARKLQLHKDEGCEPNSRQRRIELRCVGLRVAQDKSTAN